MRKVVRFSIFWNLEILFHETFDINNEFLVCEHWAVASNGQEANHAREWEMLCNMEYA